MCLIADGLYPNQSFFQICQDKGWAWIVTLKDGNLPSVWKGVLKRQGVTRCRSRHEDVRCRGQQMHRTSHWETALKYRTFTVHWFECREWGERKEYTRFVFLTNLDDVRYQTVIELTTTGRMRWKIENEGFDIQKHHGYGLGHQFSRASMQAMKNYDQLMQIAHLINQLFELGSLLLEVRRRKESLKHVWRCLVGELHQATLDFTILATMLAQRIQIRYG